MRRLLHTITTALSEISSVILLPHATWPNCHKISARWNYASAHEQTRKMKSYEGVPLKISLNFSFHVFHVSNIHINTNTQTFLVLSLSCLSSGVILELKEGIEWWTCEPAFDSRKYISVIISAFYFVKEIFALQIRALIKSSRNSSPSCDKTNHSEIR